MKFRFSFLAALAIVFGLIFVYPFNSLFSINANAADTVTLNCVSAWPINLKDTMFGYHAYAKKLDEISKGRIKLNLLGGPEIAGPKELLKLVKRGNYDMAFTAGVYYAGEAPAMQLTSFVNPYEAKAMLSDPKVIEIMDKVFRLYGVKYVSEPQAGQYFYIWTVREPALDKDGKVKDLKGFQIRSIGPLNAKQVKAVGATPVSLHPSEIYEALQRGVIDGCVNMPGSVYDYHYDEVVRFLIRPAFLNISGVIFMNPSRFDKLPKDVKAMVEQAGILTPPEIYDLHLREHAELIKKMKERQKGKLKELEASPEMLEEFHKSRMDVLDDLAKTVPTLSKEIIKVFGRYYE